jgi:hypothetical protein
VELFSAYESFNDKCLKTNIGVILGYGYGKDKSRIGDKGNMGELDIKSTSHSILLGVEFIKNLYAYDGYQFGLWLKTNYGHIFLRIDDNEKLRSSDKDCNHNFKHNFLSTVIGLNVEKETFNHADKKLILSLKVGWEFQIKYKTISFASSDSFSWLYPIKNTIILSFRASQELNDHLSIVGSYAGRFNKDFLVHSLAAGIEYAF